MTKSLFKVETSTKFLLLICSDSDLTKLEFSDLNLNILKVGSDELNDYFISSNIKGFENKNQRYITEFATKNPDKDLYLIKQNDLRKGFIEKDLFTAYNSLLVLFPSELQILAEIDFEVFDYKYINWITSTEYNIK
jgi:hypothetical protein